MIAEDVVSEEGRKFEKVCEIVERHGRKASRLIPILQAVQEEYRYLPAEVLTYVATSLELSPSKVFGVATFYAHFALAPKGKHVLRLCDGTACHVKNSIPILEALRAKLKLRGEEKTTGDMMFTVETVACLGACGLAPVVVHNEQVHGQMTPAAAVKLIEEIEAAEKAGQGEGGIRGQGDKVWGGQGA
ncbi:MAG: NAD(P)H-dependent oxidoreductase subunit E, partial [Phycisphaerales bacterium]|nr:NAD(P)H-dependent oxidoreductase subunit E [Phycisphaerales bacterium]